MVSHVLPCIPPACQSSVCSLSSKNYDNFAFALNFTLDIQKSIIFYIVYFKGLFFSDLTNYRKSRWQCSHNSQSYNFIVIARILDLDLIFHSNWVTIRSCASVFSCWGFYCSAYEAWVLVLGAVELVGPSYPYEYFAQNPGRLPGYQTHSPE